MHQTVVIFMWEQDTVMVERDHVKIITTDVRRNGFEGCIPLFAILVVHM